MNSVVEKKTFTWSYLFLIGRVQIHLIALWNKIPFTAGQYKNLSIRLDNYVSIITEILQDEIFLC